MTPEEFWPVALPYARWSAAQTGLFVSVILAQWADETEYGGTDWTVYHNPGNVGSFDGQPVHYFPTLDAGVLAYVELMNAPDRPEFAATIRKGATPATQCYLLGAADPVWASGRYALPGGAPGSALVWIIQRYNLTQYDGPAPAPQPTEADTMTSWQEGGQNHLAGVIPGVGAFHWWQTIGGNAPGQPEWWCQRLTEIPVVP